VKEQENDRVELNHSDQSSIMSVEKEVSYQKSNIITAFQKSGHIQD
jgi:hypothetical protein